MEIYTFVSIIVGLLTAYATARYGQQHYNKVLAGSFFISSFISMVVASTMAGGGALFGSFIPWAIIIVITAVLFFLARIGTYVIAGLAFTGLIILVLNGVFGAGSGGLVLVISLIVGIAITFLLRKILIPVTVGLLSGSLILSSLALILILVDPIMAMKQLMAGGSAYQIISVLILAFGVYFQFGMHEKVFGGKSAEAAEQQGEAEE